eukprot:1941577-Pyramimonas_sp.AAC.1
MEPAPSIMPEVVSDRLRPEQCSLMDPKTKAVFRARIQRARVDFICRWRENSKLKGRLVPLPPPPFSNRS